jgi:UPF0716 family protein affecting phage T7 exclusion
MEQFDWRLFLQKFLESNGVKYALGVVLNGLILLIPGLSTDMRGALVGLVLAALFVWAGVQDAKVSHDDELEWRTYQAKREAKAEKQECECNCLPK